MRIALARLLVALAAVIAMPHAARSAGPEAAPAATLDVRSLAELMFSWNADDQRIAFAAVAERRDRRMAAVMIEWLRFFGPREEALDALAGLAGERAGERWHDWMLWQQMHPEIVPFDGYDGFKADLYAELDPNFRQFLSRGVRHEIRLEEVVWGGVKKDAIPALLDPKLIPAREATYLEPDEPVFGVVIRGDARAYPLRIMDWHEMLNDVVGGVPVALAYCTLCGSGILYESQPAGQAARIVFGTSGLLYRSNKLMYDRATNSLWNQFTGRPVVGPLTGTGVGLTMRPLVIANWSKWKARHPDTKVLSLDTGHDRDYRPGRPYGGYFASRELMFPAVLQDDALAPKTEVFAVRREDAEKAWPISSFAVRPVQNDKVGRLDVVLVGAAETRTVRAYESGGRRFEAGPAADTVSAAGALWRVEEDALVGPDGIRLPRLPGHVAYWFAFQGFCPGKPVALK